MDFSAQMGYNTPMDMLQTMTDVDLPEAETLSFSNQIDSYLQVAGPADLAGKRVISVELGADWHQAYYQSWESLLFDAKHAFAFTILRPVCFMDNLTPDFIGRSFASMWRGVGDKPLQLISVHDIGMFAAKALLNPEYKGKAISLAGDELTLKQGRKVFKNTMGYAMPESFGFVGTGLKFAMKELGTMFKWFETDGYGADIPALRKEEPALQNFSTWLKESSKFSKQ